MTEASLTTESAARIDRFEATVRKTRTRHVPPTAYHPVHDAVATHRRRHSPEVIQEVLKAADTLIAVAVIAGVFTWVLGSGAGFNAGILGLVAVVAVTWRLVFLVTGLYESVAQPGWRKELPGIAAATFVGVGALAPFAYLAGAWDGLMALAVAYPCIVGGTALMRAALRSRPARAIKGAHRVVIVGSGPIALEMHRRLAGQLDSDYELLGFVDSSPHIRFGEVADRLIGSLEDLDRILMHSVVDEVLIALPVKSHYDSVQRAIEICERAGIQATYSADIFSPTIGEARYRPSGSQPTVSVQVVADDYRLSIKRGIDIIGAGVGLMALAPLFALAAIAIKLTSPGPVLYAQERYGWRKRRFRMLKFRTMVPDAEGLQAELEDRNEAVGPVFKMRNDPRVTAIGRFLRATSMDELPQLWNVLRGEMSLVGPRPLPLRDVGKFDQPWLMRRFSVVPGMTGLWQVSGRSNLGFAEWAELDLHYIDSWSLGLDARILCRTVPAVLSGTGAQ